MLPRIGNEHIKLSEMTKFDIYLAENISVDCHSGGHHSSSSLWLPCFVQAPRDAAV